MFLEGLVVFAFVMGAGYFFLVRPLRAALKARGIRDVKDDLAEAKERLEIARLEHERVRVEKAILAESEATVDEIQVDTEPSRRSTDGKSK
jgi:hypothetical protein